LIEGRSWNRSQIQTIKVSNSMFFSILDTMVGANWGDSNVWWRLCTDRLKESTEITVKVTTG